MGHYWSEMRDEAPERNPKALESMGFVEISSGRVFNMYCHEPCRQVFYILDRYRLPESIWWHGNHCAWEEK